ncbi:MAG: serine hydrolase domain-containing protein [Kofleriaceae bacterium]
MQSAPIALALVAALAVAPGQVRAAKPDPIDAFVARVMDDMHVPGLAVAVVRAGKVEKLAAYGVANLEWQIPVTPETRFQIASTTKLFSGTLVMLLVQEGKLALTDPVSKYLPDAPPAWRGVTIAHLAAHASGISDELDPKLGSVAEAYAKIRDRPLVFPTGSRDAYAGGDFIVLSRVLERVSGMSYAELLRKRLVEPLQLTCTTFEDATEVATTRTARVIPQRASVYRWERDQQRLHWFLYPPYTYASGGAFSCISDLAKWAVAMDRGALLTPESERRAATAFRITDGTSAGFGVVFSTGTQRGRRRFGHSGGPALGDVTRLPDDKLTVIVLANQQRMNPSLAPSIAGLLLPELRERAVRDAQPAWTRRLRAVADGCRSGTLDPGSFVPAQRAELVDALRAWGPVMTGTWPALDRWTLVEDGKRGGRRVRVYRAHHGAHPVRWTFTLDDAGLVSDLDVAAD